MYLLIHPIKDVHHPILLLFAFFRMPPHIMFASIVKKETGEYTSDDGEMDS